jgi:ArsR family transcriptional regulator, arsenate/arsenite/antimonite-responsive transcriptional repressor
VDRRSNIWRGEGRRASSRILLLYPLNGRKTDMGGDNDSENLTAFRGALAEVPTFAAIDSHLTHKIRYLYNYGNMKRSKVIGALNALAQETRLDIFRLLVQKGPEGLAAGEIGERLRQPSPTLSFHLNQLRFAGLVSSRRRSRSIIYSANFEAMNAVIGYLTENCCGGRPELCAPASLSACAPGKTQHSATAQPRGRISR